MSEELKFFIFLLEQYAREKKTSGDKVLRQLDDLGLTELIVEKCKDYDCENLQKAYDDIDALIAEEQALQKAQ